uniref:Paralemmin n=1 Tax=Periophthalmus magnuspinnatus TaxID=409849 RepID=A0A3B4BJC3_9GOBI
KMDEAEKYKQRLEAIAEKRRLLDEQERAKREMEDERIRLQQLKRKSLRDQWLMEGPPLSPSSLDTAPLTVPSAYILAVLIILIFLVKGETIRAVFLTNGAAGKEEDTVHVGSVNVLLTSNGLSEDVIPGQVVHLNSNTGDDEEEEGTMVIRAECVMITDEGDDTAEDDAKENGWENAISVSEESEKTVTEGIEGTVPPTVEAGQSESAIIQNGVEGDNVEEVTPVQLQTQAQEGAVVASVPVYTEPQPCIKTTQVDVEDEVASKEETIEVGSKHNVKVEFQEVPLSEPQDKHTPGEQEALLPEVKGHAIDTEKAGTSNQTESPNRADQAETKMPKRKTCQCCSVM